MLQLQDTVTPFNPRRKSCTFLWFRLDIYSLKNKSYWKGIIFSLGDNLKIILHAEPKTIGLENYRLHRCVHLEHRQTEQIIRGPPCLVHLVGWQLYLKILFI